jgi:MYXO-CTERM domain-containing protein
VLAAEEFVVPDRDPRLHPEPPHDVLAAEEFVVPALDPALHHHGPVELPGDPTGIAEPHDVLAAEEFAMPAPRSGDTGVSSAVSRARTPWLVAGAVLLGFALRRRRRSR